MTCLELQASRSNLCQLNTGDDAGRSNDQLNALMALCRMEWMLINGLDVVGRHFDLLAFSNGQVCVKLAFIFKIYGD